MAKKNRSKGHSSKKVVQRFNGSFGLNVLSQPLPHAALDILGVLGAEGVAADVNLRGNFALRYYDVSRRILRMNKRLHIETGKCLFEKRGHAWALPRFAFDSYDESIELNSEVSAVGAEEGLGLEKEDF